MKSPNEELCKSRFGNYLKNSLSTGPLAWEDGDEPPDFYLSIAGERFAVEVTILMEQFTVGESTMPTKAIRASLREFVDEVEQLARKQNTLHGTYLVLFSKPIAGFRDSKDSIRLALLNYVANTQGVERAPRQVVFKHNRQTCSIEKFHTQTDRINQAVAFNGKREDEAAAEIYNLLEERLAEKCHKLRMIHLPKIALLYDAYLFANPSMFKDCTSRLSSLDSFHTVFIVHDNYLDFILYSQNPDWIRTKAA